MHAIEGSGNVPAFLTKLWRLVDDVKTNDLICWTQSGRSFIIRNQAMFSRDLLPQYYKHNNMASFVRQLNMYGFHKVVSADSGGLRLERDEMEFAHPHFIRGQEALIENIKRKQQRRLASDGVEFSQIPTSRTIMLEENKSVNKLLCDVRDMKRDQDTMSTKLLGLKRENEALWREYANMRQKFAKQQQIIEKLIHFLIAMVKSPSKTLGSKRKFGHLALEGGEDAASAAAKLSQAATMEMVGGSTTAIGGAQIHEVTDVIDADNVNVISEFVPITEESEPAVQEPEFQSTSNVKNELETTFQDIIKDPLEPETILLLKPDAYQQVDVSNIVDSTVAIPTSISVPTVVSPEGTSLTDTDYPNVTMDDAPLSPELLETVDPSAVTQSFKYATSTSPIISSSASNGVAASAGTSGKPKTPSTSTQIIIPKKGKNKSIKSQKNSPKAKSAMSIVVPEKNFQKNSKGPAHGGQDFQSHVDEMQTNIDSLQDLLTSGSFNVDPSMLLTMFTQEDSYMPELDAMVTSSGNELSVYNPSLLDLATDIEDDPFSFLNTSLATSSSTSDTLSAASSSGTSATTSGPTPPKQLRLNVKREREEHEDLDTPQILPPGSGKPMFRGKKRGN